MTKITERNGHYQLFITPPKPTSNQIIEELNKGTPLERLIQGDTRSDLASRMAYRWNGISWDSGQIYFRRKTIELEMNAPSCEIPGAIRKLIRWGLYYQDPANSNLFHRNLLSGETRAKYKKRVQHKIKADVAIAWILRDLIAEHDIAPHSIKEFQEQTGRDQHTIVKSLAAVIDRGYVVRFNRQTYTRKSMYVRPNNETILYNLNGGYDAGEWYRGHRIKRGN